MMAEQLDVVNPLAIHLARQFMRADLGARLRSELLAQYDANQTPGAYSPDAVSAGKRALKNLALAYLNAAPDDASVALAQRQFDDAGQHDRPRRRAGRADPRARAAGAPTRWPSSTTNSQNEALVIDKWFTMQAVSARPPTWRPCAR